MTWYFNSIEQDQADPYKVWVDVGYTEAWTIEVEGRVVASGYGRGKFYFYPESWLLGTHTYTLYKKDHTVVIYGDSIDFEVKSPLAQKIANMTVGIEPVNQAYDINQSGTVDIIDALKAIQTGMWDLVGGVSAPAPTPVITPLPTPLPTGTITIEVRKEGEGLDNAYVQADYKDAGTGISVTPGTKVHFQAVAYGLTSFLYWKAPTGYQTSTNPINIQCDASGSITAVFARAEDTTTEDKTTPKPISNKVTGIGIGLIVAIVAIAYLIFRRK